VDDPLVVPLTRTAAPIRVSLVDLSRTIPVKLAVWAHKEGGKQPITINVQTKVQRRRLDEDPVVTKNENIEAGFNFVINYFSTT